MVPTNSLQVFKVKTEMMHHTIVMNFLGSSHNLLRLTNFLFFTCFWLYLFMPVLSSIRCYLINPSSSRFCACLRYVLKVTISRGYAGSITEYQDFVVKQQILLCK